MLCDAKNRVVCPDCLTATGRWPHAHHSHRGKKYRFRRVDPGTELRLSSDACRKRRLDALYWVSAGLFPPCPITSAGPLLPQLQVAFPIGHGRPTDRSGIPDDVHKRHLDCVSNPSHNKGAGEHVHNTGTGEGRRADREARRQRPIHLSVQDQLTQRRPNGIRP